MLKVDDKDFQKALDAYAATASKELPDVLNKVARDIGFTASKAAPRAVRNEIKSLHEMWKTGDLSWVKYISKWMKHGFSSGGMDSSRYKKMYRRLSKFYDRDSMSFSGTGGRYAAEARRMSKRLIASRVRAIGFIAHSFAMAARLVDPASTAALPRGKGKSKAKGWAKAANVAQGNSMSASLFMAWEVEHRKGASEIGERVMRRALASKSADMKVRIMERLQRIANQHQGKRR